MHAIYSASNLGTAGRRLSKYHKFVSQRCVEHKFRLTVVLGSFPFRYKRTGVERRGKNSEASNMSLDRVSVRRAPLDGTLVGIVPGEAEVGNHRISLVSGVRESRG